MTQLKFDFENLQAVNDWDFVLKCKLNWSKNVNEERDCPFQIVIGSMDPSYCVLMGLAVWLELAIKTHGPALASPYLFCFSPNIEIPKGRRKAKDGVERVFAKKIFCNPQFQNNELGPLGSHSIRKFAATVARNNGCTKDERDYRGRWKSNSRVSDRYDDVELPYVDGKVAGRLCMGGPCMYALKAGSGISDAFLFEHVVPGICSRLPNEVARVLALPLLFAIFSQGSGEGFPAGYLPAAFCEQVKNSYNSLAVHLGDGLNPVKRVPLAINGSDAQLFLDPIELMDVDAEEEDATVHHGACAGAGAVVNNNDVVQQAVQQQQQPLVAPHQPQHAAGLAMQGRRGGTERDIILALHSKIVQMDAEVKLIRTAFAEQQIRIERVFERGFTPVNANIRRIHQIPFAACPCCHARVNKEGAGAAASVD